MRPPPLRSGAITPLGIARASARTRAGEATLAYGRSHPPTVSPLTYIHACPVCSVLATAASHTEAIQCLAFNPVTHALASCTTTDFGYWTVESKQVQLLRHPPPSLSLSLSLFFDRVQYRRYYSAGERAYITLLEFPC